MEGNVPHHCGDSTAKNITATKELLYSMLTSRPQRRLPLLYKGGILYKFTNTHCLQEILEVRADNLPTEIIEHSNKLDGHEK